MRGKKLWLILLLVAAAAIGCESDAPPNPVGPTPPTTTRTPLSIPSPTRILRLTGKSGEPVIDFGDALVGEDRFKEFLICNAGTAAMTLEAISASDGFSASWGYYYYGAMVVGSGQCIVGSAVLRQQGPVATKVLWL